jgi:hypothetical protein
MHQSLVKFSESEASNHTPFLADFITTTSGFKFSVHTGVEFTVMEVEPGLWKWQFQIGKTVTTGKTPSNLKGMAAHRVQQRIDRELRKLRELNADSVEKHEPASLERPIREADSCSTASSMGRLLVGPISCG